MKNFKFKWLLLSFILSIASINTMWGTARTFKSGEKIYFKDASGNISWGDLKCLWKVASGNVYAYFWNDTEGLISGWGTVKYGTVNAANTIYEITVPGSGKEYTHVLFTRGEESNKWWNQTVDQTPDVGYNLFCIANDGDYDGSRSPTHKWKGNWSRYAHDGALIGDFNNWNPDTYPLSNSGVKGALVPLAASTPYKFKILLGETYYGLNSKTITSTLTTWWTFKSGEDNVNLTTDVAGDYGFAWNGSSKNVTVYYPKALYPKNKYIYFDVRNETYWNANPFTARFYLKYFDTGSNLAGMPLECSTPIEDNVYYAVVPDNGYIGQIQMNRWYNNALDGIANIAYVYDRGSANENCLKEESGKENDKDSWTPQWTIYCPPTQSETFANNGTTVISGTSGNGTLSNPYLVKTGTSIKATASATKSVDDGDMTINYDFKVNGTSQQAGTSNTFSYAASRNNTAYNVTMDAYTVYNLDGTSNSTKHTHATTLYYKALDTYSVTNTLTNISSNGRSGSDAAAYNIAYTATLSVGTGYNLPATITVKRGETTLTASTHYTYNSTTGALSINAAQVTGNLTIIAAGVAKTYTDDDNLDKNGGDSHGTYTATYDATTIAIDPAPARTNYHVEGYYLESGCTNKIADASGNLVASVVKDAVSYTDGDGKWKKDANVKLYTKWEDDIHDVTVNAQTGGTVSYNGGAAGSSCTARAGIATASADIVATASAGYYFVGWSLPDGTITKATESAYNGSTSTYTINATADGKTVTALFNVRYALLGSQDADGEPTGGMPGWGEANESPFAYSDGTYTKSVSLTVPNANYKFRIVDRRGSSHKSYGLESKAVISADNNFHDLYYDTDETTKDALLATAGRGYYTITVQTNGSGAPQVKITNPTSYLVHFGKKCFTIDGDDEGDLGGTITVSDAAGNTYADGKYIASGETVTISASAPTGYHFAEWHANSSYNYEFGDKENPHSWTVSEAVNAYAKFVEDVITPTGSGGWSTKVGASTLTDVVIISSTITVDADHALAKRVILDQSGGKAGKLVVAANKGLEVAEGILINNGASLVPPTAEDLVLESSASGNATLIFNNSNSAAATVQMYSKASVAGGIWNWQYMAPAFTDANALYDYYGSYLYKWNNGGWSPVANGATLDAFAGYCITNKTANSTYVTDGTLVPTTSHSVTLGANEDMVIGNSWTAPIYIGGFTAETFTSEPATIYLFNTGSAENGSSAGTGPGTYETIPLFSAPYVGNALIAPLQAFFVTTHNGTAGTITMNYDELVRTTTNDHSVNAGPMHAPKRVNEEEDPEVMKIWAKGAEYSDRLVILEREDFTTGFDNGWDGEKKSFSDVAPSVYVIAETEKDAVSAVPDYEGTILGFLAGIDTQCTMNFDYNGEENWYLNDLKEEKSTLITNENSYSFSCSSTDAETRFVISRTPIHKVPTGTENVSAGTNARKQMINGVLYVIRDGRIYNAEGALVK